MSNPYLNVFLVLCGAGLFGCEPLANPSGDAASDRPGVGADSRAPLMDGGSEDATTVDQPQLGLDVPPLEDASQYDALVASHRYELQFATELAAGEEATKCVVIPIGNMTDEFIRRIYVNLGDASHHLIVYRSSTAVLRDQPFACQGFSGIRSLMDFDTPLAIAQMRETTVQMPPRVGMPIDRGSFVRLEFHAVNITAAPVRAMARVLIDTVDQTAALASANLMFWGNVSINLPPNAPSDVDMFQTPLSSVRVFGLTSHTHHFGTRATIHRATATRTPVAQGNIFSNIVDGELLHESRNWSDPPLTLFDPPITFAAGEGLHLNCHYQNTSNQRVTYGESVGNEMCFLWAYYYPAPRGVHICAKGYMANGAVLCWPPA